MHNTKQINERTYAFGTLPAMEALKVEVSIARVIGEPLFKAFMEYKKTPGDNKAKEDENMVMAAGMTAIGTLAARMDAEELATNIRLVMKYVTCDGKRIQDIDAHFTGKNLELWQVFIAALRFNFSDFFSGSLFDSISEKVKLSR